MNSKYLKIKVSVNCIIKKDDKFLLVKQVRPVRAKGKWSLPGGKINNEETFEESVKREINEETGLNVRKIKHIDIIHELPTKTIKHIFSVEVDNKNDIKFNKREISEVKWFSAQEINLLKTQNRLRGDWIIDAIKTLSKKTDSPMEMCP